jgi:hypothetical protein
MSPPQSGKKPVAPPRVEPLTKCRMDGRPYVRRPDVEEQICRVRETDPATWPGLAKALPGSDERLKSETIVHLVRILRRRGESTIAGHLIEQLSKRAVKITMTWAKGFDQTTTEEIVYEVDGRSIEFILAETPTRQSEFLEVAFATAVKRRTLRRVVQLQNQPRTYQFARPSDVGDGSDGTATNPLEATPDGEPSPEEVAIAWETSDVLRRCVGAITNPKHREAVILRFVVGWPISTNDESKPSLCSHFGRSARQITNWFAEAYKEVRAAAGDSL